MFSTVQMILELYMDGRTDYRVFLLMEALLGNYKATPSGTRCTAEVLLLLRFALSSLLSEVLLFFSKRWLKKQFVRLQLKRRRSDPPDLDICLMIRVCLKVYFYEHACKNYV